MEPNLSPIRPSFKPKANHFYISIKMKFWISHAVSVGWMLFSIYLSLPWLENLSSIVSFPVALFIIGGIAYVPGYMNAFLIMSLLLDRQPTLKDEHPTDAVTLLIAAYNEEATIFDTLQYVANQDYDGEIYTVVINNNSTDHTCQEVMRAKKELNLNLTLLHEAKPGKFHALNKGLQYVTTPYVITLDADTLLHPSAIRYLVSRIESSPANVGAVAGSMLVRNSRETIWTRIQEWDYFLGIASIKRLQGLYQGTLVAQGLSACIKQNVCEKFKGGLMQLAKISY